MYTVKVSREGRYWVAEVADVPGGATETERLADLDHEVRDLLAGLLDVDEGSLEARLWLSGCLGPGERRCVGGVRARARRGLALVSCEGAHRAQPAPVSRVCVHRSGKPARLPLDPPVLYTSGREVRYGDRHAGG